MLSQDIFEFQDDGFDGSNDELLISQEVFYGNLTGDVSKKSAAVGLASSTSETDKMADTFPCSNSENSAVTNQVSSDDLCQKDADNLELYRDSRAQSSMRASFSGERLSHDVHPKRIKLSVNELCSFKPYLDNAMASSVPLKQVVYGMYHPGPCLPGQIFMSHVVESSSDGLTSSCYLLKQDLESTSEGNLGDCVGLNGSLSVSDGSEVKQVGAFKSMASPNSQESYATKLLVSSPSPADVSASGSSRLTKKKSKVATWNFDDDNVQLTGNSVKDLSTLLRSKVYQLLKRLGWSLELQVRNDGRNRYLYRTPDGRLVRAFARVWPLVGNTLFAHNNSKMTVDDKQWTDINEFYSDLYDALNYVENKKDDWKSRCGIICLYRLLDPFVNMVLVSRKMTALRAGNLVKTNKNNELDAVSNAEVECNVKSGNCDVDRNVNMPSEEIICDSSLGIGARETHKTRSVYVSEGNSMCLVETIDKDERLGIITDENVHQLSANLPENVVQVNSKDGTVCSVEGGAEPCKRTMVHAQVDLMKKTGDKFIKFPAVELCDLCQAEPCEISLTDDWSDQSKAEIEHWSMEFIKNKKKLKKKSKLKKSRPNKSDDGFCLEETNSDINADVLKKDVRLKKGGNVKRKTKRGQLKDDDLLVSAIIKKRSFRSGKDKVGPKPRKFKSKSLKKRKSKKGSCRLRLRGIGKGGKHLTDRWTLTSERTILSWLISTGAVSINEAIQYRDPKGDTVVKDGLISRDGILCRCCNEIFSVSEFKIHAGFNQNRPCLNLFMGSGRPYTLSQLQAWSDEYKLRKNRTLSVPVDEFDKNDDSCGLCGDVGELLCCDNCPSTFHQSCLSAEEIPEGSWYCPNCTCQVCGQLANDMENSSPCAALRCSQCERKFHKACLTEKDMSRDGGATWFCGASCEEVYGGLQSRIAFSNQIGDGCSWTLLRCIQDDQKVSSAQRFALKAECNSKLAVAATIMEECFLSMIDPRTGIDMIPQVVYNWGSEFARLDYHGFYTAVLEKNDILISIASIRVHGVSLAELPLIATCSKYRRQGMCRRLLTLIEKMLTSLKVEKLVIAAIPDLVETWTVGFGFVPMEEDEKRSLNKINLMVFPGTVLLKKTLFGNKDVQKGVDTELAMERNESVRMEICSIGIAERGASNENCEDYSVNDVAAELHKTSVQTRKCSEDAEMKSELVQDICSLEVVLVGPDVEVLRQEEIFEHLNTPVGSEKETNSDRTIGRAETLMEVSPMELSNLPVCMDTTYTTNDILGNCSDEFAVGLKETLPEYPSHVAMHAETSCMELDKALEENNCSGSETVKTKVNNSVGLEPVTVTEETVPDRQQAGRSKTMGNEISNLIGTKEAGTGAQSMNNIWDYWDECIGDLEPLEAVLNLSDVHRRFVAKERVSNSETQCVNVAQIQVPLIKESQEGNVLP
ncbi:increased DNA methylation 1 [Silene latifolia]|uniref:increased DNA methylation 1 n=1 Tax=Silene latifolia TaxID=37657 RepID=UPI003D76F929